MEKRVFSGTDDDYTACRKYRVRTSFMSGATLFPDWIDREGAAVTPLQRVRFFPLLIPLPSVSIYRTALVLASLRQCRVVSCFSSEILHFHVDYFRVTLSKCV